MNGSSANGQVPTAPPEAEITEVAPGVFGLSLPVPFKGLRQVNLWLIEGTGDEGWTMIDCGWSDAATHARIEAAWKELLGRDRLSRLIVTHFHPDHMGNCRWIGTYWGLTPLVTRTEWFAAQASARLLFFDDTESQARFFRAHGVQEASVARYLDEFLLYDRGVALTDAYRRIRHGQTLRFGGADWQVLVGSGHAPEMATLYCPERKLYLSADQVLPRISSNVGVAHWEPEADPLEEFLFTLDRIASEVSPEALVLPSHGRPFHDAPARIDELRLHHDERLEAILEILDETGAMSAGDCLSRLFQYELDGTQIAFALGEVVAHLNHLAARGALTRDAGTDGIIRFRRRPQT